MKVSSRNLFEERMVVAGFQVEEDDNLFNDLKILRVEKDGVEVAAIDAAAKHSFSTLFRKFDELSVVEKEYLINHITEYTSSIDEDVEDEELEPKYRYKNSCGEYINYNIADDHLFFSSRVNTDEYQTEFTDDEVDEFDPDRYLVFEACQKELVE